MTKRGLLPALALAGTLMGTHLAGLAQEPQTDASGAAAAAGPDRPVGTETADPRLARGAAGAAGEGAGRDRKPAEGPTRVENARGTIKIYPSF
jgi:hypothetical protein